MTKPALVDRYITTLVNKHGWWYKSAKLPRYIEYGQENRCFDNALLICMNHREYSYVEGLAYVNGEVYVHAWFTDGKQAFDPTWKAENKHGKIIRATLPILYQGVTIPTDWAMRYFHSTGNSGVIPNRELRPDRFKALIEESRKSWAK